MKKNRLGSARDKCEIVVNYLRKYYVSERGPPRPDRVRRQSECFFPPLETRRRGTNNYARHHSKHVQYLLRRGAPRKRRLVPYSPLYPVYRGPGREPGDGEIRVTKHGAHGSRDVSR